MKKNVIVALSLLLAFTVGCKNEVTKTQAPAAPQAVTTEPATGGVLSGKVVETMDAAGYTYVLVDNGTEKVWAAGPKTMVKAGDEISIPEGSPMTNFESKALNRTFEQILFASTIMVAGAENAMATQALPADHPQTAPAAAVDVKGITKPKGGKSVAEVFAERKELDGQSVVLRGKVVKAMSGIMGKNWLHIKDGTGAGGADDLVVTTSAAAKMGDKVLVSGKVAADKDFGSGYRYDVIIEDAEVTVE